MLSLSSELKLQLVGPTLDQLKRSNHITWDVADVSVNAVYQDTDTGTDRLIVDSRYSKTTTVGQTTTVVTVDLRTYIYSNPIPNSSAILGEAFTGNNGSEVPMLTHAITMHPLEFNTAKSALNRMEVLNVAPLPEGITYGGCLFGSATVATSVINSDWLAGHNTTTSGVILVGTNALLVESAAGTTSLVEYQFDESAPGHPIIDNAFVALNADTTVGGTTAQGKDNFIYMIGAGANNTLVSRYNYMFGNFAVNPYNFGGFPPKRILYNEVTDALYTFHQPPAPIYQVYLNNVDMATTPTSISPIGTSFTGAYRTATMIGSKCFIASSSGVVALDLTNNNCISVNGAWINSTDGMLLDGTTPTSAFPTTLLELRDGNIFVLSADTAGTTAYYAVIDLTGETVVAPTALPAGINNYCRPIERVAGIITLSTAGTDVANPSYTAIELEVDTGEVDILSTASAVLTNVLKKAFLGPDGKVYISARFTEADTHMPAVTPCGNADVLSPTDLAWHLHPHRNNF